MAYAAYREHPGTLRSSNEPEAAAFGVLDVSIACSDARRVRQMIARCPDAGVVRCEPLLHHSGSQEDDAPRVRLMIRLPLSSYAPLLHGLLTLVPSGEIGRLLTWRDHLARCGLQHG